MYFYSPQLAISPTNPDTLQVLISADNSFNDMNNQMLWSFNGPINNLACLPMPVVDQVLYYIRSKYIKLVHFFLLTRFDP